MNLKLTLWKSIVSLIASILIVYYYTKNNLIINDKAVQTFDWISFLIWLISLIIIYVLWSLFDKKK